MTSANNHGKVPSDVKVPTVAYETSASKIPSQRRSASHGGITRIGHQSARAGCPTDLPAKCLERRPAGGDQQVARCQGRGRSHQGVHSELSGGVPSHCCGHHCFERSGRTPRDPESVGGTSTSNFGHVGSNGASAYGAASLFIAADRALSGLQLSGLWLRLFVPLFL